MLKSIKSAKRSLQVMGTRVARFGLVKQPSNVHPFYPHERNREWLAKHNYKMEVKSQESVSLKGLYNSGESHGMSVHHEPEQGKQR